MSLILPDGENSLLSSFLRRNIPDCLFRADEPVICFGTKRLPEGAFLITDGTSPLPAGAEKLRVITCGLSEKATFTYSAKGEDSASVALMRAVETATGTLEPMELQVEFPAGTDDLAVLGTTAALVLGGVQISGRLRLCPPDQD